MTAGLLNTSHENVPYLSLSIEIESEEGVRGIEGRVGRGGEGRGEGGGKDTT